jgi:hypothetical protein
MSIRREFGEIAGRYVGKSHLGDLKCGYLDIVGETKPKLSNLPIIENGKEKYDFYVYEYWWTLGFTRTISERASCKHEGKTVSTVPYQRRRGGWTNLKKSGNEAILVQIFFHTQGTNYSVKDIAGTIKPPFMIQRRVRDFLGDSWMRLTGTAVQSFGEYTKIPMVKEIGSEITDAIVRFEKDAAPSSSAYPWISKKIATYEGEGKELKQLDGVEWRISRRAHLNLGNRLEGALGLTFIESSEKENAKPLELEIRARISFEKSKKDNLNADSSIWIPWDPNESNFDEKKICLAVTPTNPN